MAGTSRLSMDELVKLDTFTMSQVGRLTGLSRFIVRTWVERGLLPARIESANKYCYINRNDLIAFLASHNIPDCGLARPPATEDAS